MQQYTSVKNQNNEPLNMNDSKNYKDEVTEKVGVSIGLKTC